jgi:MraZ protein
MLNLLGEYPSTLDAKSRVLLPAALKKQLGGEESKGFVVNRDVFSECLVLYPMEEWNKTSADVRRLNRFDPENVEFIRRFLNGATPVELDANGRLLIPKPLMAYARLEQGRRVHGHGRSHRDVERGTAQACIGRERGLQVTGSESDGREA